MKTTRNKVHVNFGSKITNYEMRVAGITQDKQKCLIFIMVPQKIEKNEMNSQRKKKVQWINLKRKSIQKSKKKNNSSSSDKQY